MDQPITYPQYRKYPNNKGYFKIETADSWEEIQLIGSKASLNTYKVTIFPDRNYINDLTFDYENNWVKIEEEEYENIKKNIALSPK